MRLAQILQETVSKLNEANVETAEIDAQLLCGHCLNKSRSQLFLSANENLNEKEVEHIRSLVSRRVAREPLAYITETQEFWSLDFSVSPAVLIPRPETEFMLEKVFSRREKWEEDSVTILDLCTGSGAIAIVLAKELGKTVDAVDISESALVIAQKNIEKHDLVGQVQLYKSDLVSELPTGTKYKLIVSNPPYVRLTSIENELEPEVAAFEPRLALDGGGDDGLDIIRRMRKDLVDKLHLGGEVFIEFGAEQGEAMIEIFSVIGDDGSVFDEVVVYKDYAGRDRVLHATLVQNSYNV